MKKIIIICAIILAAGHMTFAAVVPPWRGAQGSTLQGWGFFNNDKTPEVPDIVNNQFGDPLLNVDTTFNWIPELLGKNGLWALSGEMDVYIPNRQVVGGFKEIWLQLTWRPANLNPDPFLPDQPVVGVTTNPQFLAMSTSYAESTDEGGWKHSLYRMQLTPNPLEEWFTIKGDIIVDELIIDTICIAVPEPATILLLGTCGLMGLFKKQRPTKKFCASEKQVM